MSERNEALNLGQRRELVRVATHGIGPEFGRAENPDSLYRLGDRPEMATAKNSTMKCALRALAWVRLLVSG